MVKDCDITDKKKTRDNKEVITSGASGQKDATKRVFNTSLIYTLVDEALVAHREQLYADMYDCVITSGYILGDKSERLNDLFSMLRSVNIIDINGKIAYIPAENLMMAMSFHLNSRDESIVRLLDCDENVVVVTVSRLRGVYHHIGRILLITLFELLDVNAIVLPENMFDNRKILGD